MSHKSINLISSYLHDRRYAIRYSGAQSNFTKLDTGIPQGSSLGPLLFLVYINDLALLDLPSQLVLFADDSTISAAGESYGEACRLIAIDLELICTWLSHNRLVVNWSKTNHMLIGSSTNDASLLAINGNTLERLDSVKLLGVEIDSQLKFEKHINIVCSKVNKKAYLISRRFFLFDLKFRTTLFKLFIIPHFEYCSSLFYNTYSSITATLFKCFKKNLKLFLNIDIHNIDLPMQLSVLQPFNILPISLRLFTHFCTFIHSIFSNSHCLSLINSFIQHKSTYSLRCNFILPSYHTHFGKQSFIFFGTKVLNLFVFSHLLTPKLAFKDYLIHNCLYYFNKLF